MSSKDTSSRQFTAGAVSGLVEAFAVQPLDMVKTRFQLSCAKTKNPNVFAALIDIVREGGFFRLYRGILPELAGMIPKNSVMFGTYGAVERELRNSGYFAKSGDIYRDLMVMSSPPIVHGIAGALAGVTEAVTVTPFQVVKIRLQAKEHLGKYTNSFQAAATILRHEGPAALMTGFIATAYRNSIWNGVYFATMQYLRDHKSSFFSFPVYSSSNSAIKVVPLISANNSRQSSSLYNLLEPQTVIVEHTDTMMETFLMGTGAGMFATFFNCPFDVIKSRTQTVIKTTPVGSTPVLPPPKKPTVLRTFYNIAITEGIPSLYRGLVPKMMRMGFGGGVSIACFEAICRL